MLGSAGLVWAPQADPATAAHPMPPDAPPPHKPQEMSTVSIVDFAFDPQVVTITVGSSVEWTNAGSFTHTTTSDTGVWDSGQLGPGDVFSTTFNSPGSYPYHCAIHSFMQGRVVVLTNVYLPLIMRS